MDSSPELFIFLPSRYGLKDICILKFSLIRRPTKPKQIGRAPILGRPRLFGGKLLDYIQVTQQHIPLIISTCVGAINRLGLHNQVCIIMKIGMYRANKRFT